MSTPIALPDSALEFMNAAEPDQEQCAALAGLSALAFEALVNALERREQLDHLELLGELDAASREARKRAAAAVYRLRSRGVRGSMAPGRKAQEAAESSPQSAAAEAVDLGLVALASPPGLVGRLWLLLGSLPGLESIEVKGDADGGVEGIEVLRPVSKSKLEKLAREFDRKAVRGLPVRASADLAVELATRWGESLPPERRPPLWGQVEAWCRRAVSLGADPARAQARRIVKPDPAAMPAAALYALEAGGLHMPTPAVIQRVLVGMRELLDRPAIESAEVERRARQLTRGAMEGWLDVPAVRERLARWMECTADVLCARQAEGAERTKMIAAGAGLLALADALVGASDGAAIARHPFFLEVEGALLGTSGRP